MSSDSPLYPGDEPLPFALPQGHIHTSFGVRPGDQLKAFQWFPLACNIPIEDSLEVLATSKPPRAPSCALWVLVIIASPTHLQPNGSQELQLNLHHRLVRQD
jgi:hypothetical protein